MEFSDNKIDGIELNNKTLVMLTEYFLNFVKEINNTRTKKYPTFIKYTEKKVNKIERASFWYSNSTQKGFDIDLHVEVKSGKIAEYSIKLP